MKPLSVTPNTRRARLALAACGVVLLVAAGWLLREPPVVAPVTGARPLEPLLGLRNPKSLYEERKSGVRPTLVEALALDSNVPYPRRIEILRATGSDLAAMEIDLLVAALLAEVTPPEAIGDQSTWFHETANLLHRQRSSQGPLARALATVAADPARDATLRDYALQHLRVVWNRSGKDAGLRDAITASLRQLASADKTVTTAALLSLHLLGDNAAAPENPVTRALGDNEIVAHAGNMLEGPPGSRQPAERMSAARIAADRRLASLRPALARVASNPAEHVLSRISAINAMGHIGDPADRSLLESLSLSEPSLAAATHKALESIR